MLRLRIVFAVLTALAAIHSPTAAEDLSPEERLAMQLDRLAVQLLKSDAITPLTIETAAILIREATELDPGNAELWRFAATVAKLSDNESDYRRALGQILRLDPHDDVARLNRVNLDLERFNNVDDRIHRYRSLLTEENRERLGRGVASRLALDLALLLDRHGDIDGFSEALTLAVEIDPANRAAAAIAAGFFRMHVEDPYAQAELLTNLVLADPTDATTQVVLARLLLENGAYEGAERMYGLAIGNFDSSGHSRPGSLLADYAITQWANGRGDAALAAIHLRQQEVDRRFRFEARKENPDLNPVERAKLHAPLTLTLASAHAAIAVSQNEPDSMATVERTIERYQDLIANGSDGKPLAPNLVVEGRLQMAWVSIWLEGDLERAESFIRMAEQDHQLSDEARIRFDGWLALRRGEFDRAIELLDQVAQSDPAAQLGLAQAYLETGRRRDGARALLATMLSQPCSLLGVWAANQLADLLGRRVPATEHAQRLEELIASIPQYFFRYPQSPTLAVEVKANPAKMVFQPWEPVIINIEITNNSGFPLAIDRDGPIRPQVILLFSSTLQTIGVKQELPPVVIDIERRTRLEPRETITIPVNLMRYQLGTELQPIADRGTLLSARALLNFTVTNKAIVVPTLLGSMVETPPIRVEGVDIGSTWVVQTVQGLAELDKSDLVRMAMLANVVVRPLSARAGDEQRRLLSAAAEALTDAYSKLDSKSQAWLLSVIPAGKMHPGIRDLAQQSEDHHVQLTYVLFHLAGLDDPMLETAMQSENKNLARFAELYSGVQTSIQARPAPGTPPSGTRPAPGR